MDYKKIKKETKEAKPELTTEQKEALKKYNQQKQGFIDNWCNKMSDATKAAYIFDLANTLGHVNHILHAAQRPPKERSRIITPH